MSIKLGHERFDAEANIACTVQCTIAAYVAKQPTYWVRILRIRWSSEVAEV